MAVKEVAPFLTPKFRGAFVYVLRGKKAKVREGEKPKSDRYTILMLYPPGPALIAPLRAGAMEAAVNFWGADKAANIMKMPTFQSPFKKGLEVVNGEGEPYFPFADGWTAIEAWSYTKPGVVHQDEIDEMTGKLRHLTQDSEFYSGCWARAKVRPYAYDGRKDNKGFGVNFDLVNLQKLGDDTPFGAVRTKAEDDFQPVAPADDADFM